MAASARVVNPMYDDENGYLDVAAQKMIPAEPSKISNIAVAVEDLEADTKSLRKTVRYLTYGVAFSILLSLIATGLAVASMSNTADSTPNEDLLMPNDDVKLLRASLEHQHTELKAQNDTLNARLEQQQTELKAQNDTVKALRTSLEQQQMELKTLGAPKQDCCQANSSFNHSHMEEKLADIVTKTKSQIQFLNSSIEERLINLTNVTNIGKMDLDTIKIDTVKLAKDSEECKNSLTAVKSKLDDPLEISTFGEYNRGKGDISSLLVATMTNILDSQYIFSDPQHIQAAFDYYFYRPSGGEPYQSGYFWNFTVVKGMDYLHLHPVNIKAYMIEIAAPYPFDYFPRTGFSYPCAYYNFPVAHGETYWVRFMALLPRNYTFQYAGNYALMNWLSPNEGTGDWTFYTFKVQTNLKKGQWSANEGYVGVTSPQNSSLVYFISSWEIFKMDFGGAAQKESVRDINDQLTNTLSLYCKKNLDGPLVHVTTEDMSNITGTGETSHSHHFKIDNKNLILVGSANHSMTSTASIYEQEGDTLTFLQHFQTSSTVTDSVFYQAKNGDEFLLLVCYTDGSSVEKDSIIYKWNNSEFVEEKRLQVTGAYRTKIFNWEGEQFLAITTKRNNDGLGTGVQLYNVEHNGSLSQHYYFSENSGVSIAFQTIHDKAYVIITGWMGHYIRIYNFNNNASLITEHQTIHENVSWPVAVDTFQKDDESYIVVANQAQENDFAQKNTNSMVFKFSRKSNKYEPHQIFSTQHPSDIEIMEVGGTVFMAVVNMQDGANYEIDSVLYEWNPVTDTFFERKKLLGVRAYDFEHYQIGHVHYLSFANSSTLEIFELIRC
eukprot:m.298298 g.298298  ORF g.298298 m.298298 type:complete len:833 (+) comp16408_c2_seq4:116-2614(+)